MKYAYWLLLICVLFGWSTSSTIRASKADLSFPFHSESLYTQYCLTTITHPDLFYLKWKTTKTESPVSDSTKIKQQKDFTAPVLTERPHRRVPIPLNELDSSLVQRVYFGYNKDYLDPEAKSGIQINAEWIKKHTKHDILLEGHCDKRGSDEYNIALGDRRASAVREYMIRLGIPSSRIITRSYGEEKPLDIREKPDAYMINRRVEFYAVP